MKIAYFETIGGASGNMMLGALIDAGADRAAIEAALRGIAVGAWSTRCERVVKRGVAATHFDFAVPGDGTGEHGRHLADVLALVDGSSLSLTVKRRARDVYVRLAEAEARVHGRAVDEIHFHEVGAVDAVLDVAGTCVALELLGVEAAYCSAFPLGRGEIAMAHGRYPNPPPATADLLRGAPTYDAGFDGETVTTTGAALLTTLVARPGLRPPMIVDAIGYGAGSANFPVPNVLRVSLGMATATADTDAVDRDTVAVCEATIDDMSPQHFELAMERVLAAGAFDVWLAPVTMKKQRPAVLFGAVAPRAAEAAVAAAMLAQTSTLGVRVRHDARYTVPRAVASVETPLGAVRVKTATVDGRERRTLEYDDVVRIARTHARPIAEIAARLQEYLRPS
ncbi:MAG: nickel pincer cofactor biosynthesis protein LarC [Vulcanimicrobiaceae bacterium]